MTCELCTPIESPAWVLVHREADLRVIRVLDAPDYPGFYRVIWNAHVAELSELSAAQRARCMAAVVAVEQVLRRALQPTKINLAALGNMVPHLHWHVIARFDWDAHFPQPIWGTRQRQPEPSALQRLAFDGPALDDQVRQAVQAALAAEGVHP